MPGLLWHESTAAARTSRHLRIPERCSPLTIEPTILSPSSIDFRKLDEDAVRATQRLNQRGFEAYLVGGCVRDLLLGLRPKDYDIATAARPQQVKRTFPRNCRIIGRRFKLAHLHFHGNTKILEVSTFRQMPLADNSENAQPDLLIKHDNEFGNAEEDALRRDFTVNALFLDVGQNCILDYANGLQDLYDRTIRTIGDPRVRFREDPVRILRAAKFAGRLGFHVEPETLAAMAETAPDLVRSAPPRLLEEILRLLRSGHALDSFQLLRDVGALKSLVPVLADFLAVATQPQRVEFWRLLEALDHRVHDGHVPPNPVLLGALLLCPVLLRCAESPHRSPSTVAEELLGPLSVTLRLPRRDSGCLKRICGTAHRFLQLDDTRRFNVAGFSTGPYFDEAFDLFLLRAEATTIDPVLVANWQRIAEDSHAQRRHHSDQPFQNDAGFDDELAAVRPHDARRAPANAPDAPPDEDAGDRVEGEREDGDAAQDRGDSEGTSRRRRRRRRGGRGDEPEQVRRPTERRDEPADPTIGDASESGFESDEREVEGDTDRGASDTDGGDSQNQQGEQAHDDGDGSRRKRRRRRRRRNGAGEGQEDAPEGQLEGARADGPPQKEQRPAQQPQRQQPQRQPRQPHSQGAHAQQPDTQRAQHGGQQGGDRQDRSNRRDRDRDRRGRSGRGRRDGAPRDVDVVPRGQDRRGKVDVIEPQHLDLTAFDIELDPKRVPTFGSIVEGKGRQKRKPPRLPDEGRDDYKPPPPPGQNDDPSNAPPPPVDDTFGDW